MNYRKIFWGVLLIFIGILIILRNVGVMYFSWWSLFRLWPLLLILWGISVIPVKNYVKLILSLITIVIGLGLVSRYHDTYPRFRFYDHPRGFHYWWDDRDKEEEKEYDEYDWDKDAEYSSQSFSEPYLDSVEQAKLYLDAAAGTFDIVDWTDDLIEFNKKGNFGNYSMTSQDVDSKRIINLKLTNTRVRKLQRKGDFVTIKLNRNPLWSFDMDIGAADVNFDFSGFKTEDIVIDGGASSIELKLGDRYNEIKVNIDAGASSLKINIPEESGCEVSGTTVLSSKSFDNFQRLDKTTYRTGNFESSSNRIMITLDAAVSSFQINRY